MTVVAVVLIVMGRRERLQNVAQSMVTNYATIPKTIRNRVHLVVPYKAYTDIIDMVIMWILTQTERIDAVSITVPCHFEKKQIEGVDVLCERKHDGSLTKLTKDTCMVQLAGGYSMLLKEPHNNTIILYLRPDLDSSVFEDTQSIRKALYHSDQSVFRTINTSINLPYTAIYA